MRLPDGYIKYMIKVHNVVIDPATHVVLLKKAVYGLVQAVDNRGRNLRESRKPVTIFQGNLTHNILLRKRKEENQYHF
jgi:hypothetical protein